MNTTKMLSRGYAAKVMHKLTLRDFHRMAVINKFIGN